jgi:hypothetical protein
MAGAMTLLMTFKAWTVVGVYNLYDGVQIRGDI